METKRIFYGLLVVMLLAFVAGAGVSLYKRNFDPHYWSKDGIRGVREGCLQIGKSAEFCECYTKEIVTRMSMKQFNKMTAEINKNEAVTAQAKQFVDSVISACSDKK